MTRPAPIQPRSGRRVLERALGVRDGVILCPRQGAIPESECGSCPYLCRFDVDPPGVVCSFPFRVDDTFARRRRSSEGVRIALQHSLERT